jgi:hypothetical protein
MRIDSYDMADPVWIRDQTARILHRYVLSGKHFPLDLDALLSRLARLQKAGGECPAF